MQDKEELTSMVTILNQLRQEGYTAEFKITDDGTMCVIDDKESFRPDQLRIVNFYRFEGESNPDDMAILYVVEAENGQKGTITDAYGTYSDLSLENFMRQVQDMGKNLDKHI